MIKKSSIFLFLYCFLILISCGEKVNSKYSFNVEYLNNTGEFIFKDEYRKKIADKSYDLLEYIKNQDTDSILDMCHEGYIMYDSMNESHITKKNLFKDFRSKGDVYSLLFDSENYYKRNRQFIDHITSDDARKDYKLCLRDVLLKYPAIRVRKMQIFNVSKSVTVYLDWEDKDISQSSRIGYNIGFVYVDNKWKIKSLLDRSAY